MNRGTGEGSLFDLTPIRPFPDSPIRFWFFIRGCFMILVTGGTGFVGSHLIRRMRKGDIPVRAVVRDPNKAAWLRDLGVDVVKGDISDKASLEKAAEGTERVVHLVGIIQETARSTFRAVHV